MDSTDVVVIGAGPAGSAAAHLLARWGHSVVLITGPARRAQNLAESLPPSIRKLLIIVGLADCVESAGFVRSEGNTSWWGASEPRIETFPGPPEQRGYQVHRPHFDHVLLDSVAATDVDVRPGRVRRVDVQASAGARVEYLDRGTPRVTAAQLVLDCSGRAGVIGRHELRRPEPGHETIALTAAWQRNKPWDGFAPSHTLVETFDDGWAWSIPVSPSTRYVTVMVDKELKRHDPGAGSTAQDPAHVLGLAGRYRAELAKTKVLARLVEHACPCGTVSACDASLYSSRRYADSQFLLVGDAGSFIDPLSSYGIKKALASAWLAAVAAHTAIKHPGLRSTALDFFEQRERQVYSSYLAQAVHYFRDAAECHSHPFWQRRGASTLTRGDPCTPLPIVASHASLDVARDAPSRGRGAGPLWAPQRGCCVGDPAGPAPLRSSVEEQSWVFNEEILRQDRDVLRAFDWLRRSASIQLRPNAGVTCENRPAVVENEIVLAATVIGPGIPAGARFLGGVHLPSLVSMVSERGHVPELFELYNRRHPPVSLPDFLGALSVLIGKGILVNHGDELMKA